MRILTAFREAGIEMPTPQHDLQPRDFDPVRGVGLRAIEERRRESGVEVRSQPAPQGGDDNVPPLRPAASRQTA